MVPSLPGGGRSPACFGEFCYTKHVSGSRQYTVTGIVLRARAYGEGHRLFTLFTREQGKLAAVAKGVQKPRARLASALQQFCYGEIHLAQGRRLDVITQMRVLCPLYGLRSGMEALAYACYFAELFDQALEERQAHPELFDLLLDALQRLATGEARPDLLARYVEISLVAILGYLPQLTHCVSCRQPLAQRDAEGRDVWPTWLGFTASHGGALCPSCLPHVPGARRIAAGTVQVVWLLLAHGPQALEGVELSDRLRRELAGTMQAYLEYRLERSLCSVRFLHEWDAIPACTALSPDGDTPVIVASSSQESPLPGGNQPGK